MTDFEQYPKHRLEKKGTTIQQILDVASNVFGMTYDQLTTTFPSLKDKIGGAENLQRGTTGNGSKVFFNDQLTPDLAQGILYITPDNEERIPVAIGNYAQDDSVLQLFSDEILDIEELEAADTPEISFESGTLYTLEDGEHSTNVVRFKVTTAHEGEEPTSVLFFQNSLQVPQLNLQKVGHQCCEIFALGDNSYTKDSMPATHYQVSLGVPQIITQPTTADSDSNIQLRFPENLTGTQYLLPTETEIAQKIKYILINYDYNNFTSTENPQIREAVDGTQMELSYGGYLAAWLEPDATDAFDNIYIFPTYKRIATNFKTLSTPTVEYYTNAQQAIIKANLADSDTTLKIMVSKKAIGETDFSEAILYNTTQVELSDIEPGTELRIQVMAENRTIQVEGIEDPLSISFYNPSPELIYTCNA